MKSKTLVGTVLGNKMNKTVVVRVVRRATNQRLSKIVTLRKKFKAHDEKNECRVGDKVQLVACRPLSREKRWRVASVIEKAVVEGVEA